MTDRVALTSVSFRCGIPAWFKTGIVRQALIRLALRANEVPSVGPSDGTMPKLSTLARILVIRPDGIGDFILTIPFLRGLRESAPRARIILAVLPHNYELARRCPYVDAVKCLPANVARVGSIRRYLLARRYAIQHLRCEAPELAIAPRWDDDRNFAFFMAMFSGANWRCGYSERVNAGRQLWDRGFDRLLTHPVNIGGIRHELERGVELLEHMGGSVSSKRLEVWTNNEDEMVASRIFSEHVPLCPGPLLAFAPGASAAQRRWPIERFAELASRTIAEFQGTAVLIGGEADRGLADALQSRCGCKTANLAGLLSLPQLAAVLKRCTLFVGNDSGPAHLAAATGIPTVVVSPHPIEGDENSSTSPVRFKPWSTRTAVVQPLRAVSPCLVECGASEAHCICQVTVDQIKTAVDTVIRPPAKQH
jgi:ADP-heptose:LPS heptosyltransferase